MEMTILRAGMLTTVQDLGRPGQLAQGVPCGGAADPFALRVANLLVGNPEGAPGLEVTLTGPEIEFGEATWAAVCGARFEGVPGWRPVHFLKGERLVFGRRTQGCRAYLALGGGLDVESTMGGRGTCLAGGFGGFLGRALRDGDVLHVHRSRRLSSGHWRIDERILPRYSSEPCVRALPGSQAEEFGPAFYSERFEVTSRSSRMGIRLGGPVLARTGGGELVSSAVAPGTVQVPPDGQPIVLMADAQTLGGYPRVAHVASVDLPLLAQLAPGDAVRFTLTTVEEAHALARASDHSLALLRQGLAAKFTDA